MIALHVVLVIPMLLIVVILMVLLDGARFHGPGVLGRLGLALERAGLLLGGFAMVHPQLLGLWRVDMVHLACMTGRWWWWAWRNPSHGLGFRQHVRWWRSAGWLWPHGAPRLGCAWLACAWLGPHRVGAKTKPLCLSVDLRHEVFVQPCHASLPEVRHQVLLDPPHHGFAHFVMGELLHG